MLIFLNQPAKGDWKHSHSFFCKFPYKKNGRI